MAEVVALWHPLSESPPPMIGLPAWVLHPRTFATQGLPPRQESPATWERRGNGV